MTKQANTIKKIDVCYASSNEYSKYTGISILSLLENNAEVIANVILLSFKISKDNLRLISDICKGFDVGFRVIDGYTKTEEICKKYGIDEFEGSYATYSRAFISEIIEHNGTILYIDSDTVVNGKIDSLLSINFEQERKAFAAVIGVNQYFPANKDFSKITGKKYFQCGVILYDMKQWVELGCDKMILEYIRLHKGQTFKYADQSLINLSVSSEYGYVLGPKFNYWGHIFKKKRAIYELSRGGFYKKKDIKEAIEKPIIIHYKGAIAHPWSVGNVSNLSNVYHFYKEQSPWKDDLEQSIYYDESALKETPEKRKSVCKAIKYVNTPTAKVRLIDLKWRIINLFSRSRKK